MNWKLYLAAGLTLFALGFWTGQIGRPSSEELGAAHEATKEALAKATEAEQAREAIEVGAKAAVEQQTHVADSALALAKAAQARQPTVVDRIVNREAPADTTVARRVAESVADSITTTVVRPLYAALAAADSVNHAQETLLVAERNARQTAQDALRTALAENDLLRSVRPSWFAREAIPALKIVGAAVGGYEAGKHWPNLLPNPL